MKPHIALVACCALSFSALSQELTFIKDIDTTLAPMARSHAIMELDGLILMAYDDGGHGEELFYMTNVDDVPKLFKDFTPGIFGSSLSNFLRVGDLMYFTVGNSLFVTDGVPEHTISLAESSSRPVSLTPFNGKLLFRITEPLNGEDQLIYITDGTLEGTQLLKRFKSAGNTGRFPIINNKAILYGYVTSGPHEYWVTDGTVAGTTPVSQTSGLPQISSEHYQFNGKVYFSAFSSAEVWRTDGTGPGTGQFGASLLSGMNGGTVFNGQFYFTTNGSNTGALWTLSPSGAPVKVVDGNPIDILGATPDYFLLARNNGLWKSNGTAAGTTLIKELSHNGEVFNPEAAHPVGENKFVVRGGHASSSIGEKLWLTDGTPEGTVMYSEFANGTWTFDPQGFQAKGYCFIKSSGAGNGTYYLNGEPHDAHIIERSGRTGGSHPQSFFQFNDKVLFAIIPDNQTSQLWITEGGEENTIPIEREQDRTRSTFMFPVEYHGAVYYSKSTPNQATIQLWKTDGTTEGTMLVKEVSSISGLRINLTNKYIFKDKIYFWLSTAQESELWSSDGTPEGTVTIISIQGPIAKEDISFTNDFFYFMGENPVTGKDAIIKSDGTEAGTVVMRDFANFGSWNMLLALNGSLYFIANDGSTGAELWSLDLTTETFSLVRDLGTGSSVSRLFGLSNGKIFMSATDHVHGYELWVSDGTYEGTQMVQDYVPGSGSIPFNVGVQYVYDGKMYFDYSSVTLMSDGTPDNITQFHDRSTSRFFSNSRGLFFAVEDSELFMSQGTPETITETGINGEIPILAARPFYEFGDLMLFNDGSAFDKGNELGALDFRSQEQSISFTCTDKGYNDPDFELIATSSTGLPVTFSSSDEQILSIQGNVAHIKRPGQVNIRASQGGNSTIASAHKEVTITISGHAQTLDFNLIESMPYARHDTIVFNATASSGLPVLFETGNGSIVKIRKNKGVIMGAGQVTITAIQEGDHVHEWISVSKELTIEKASQQIIIAEERTVHYTTEPVDIEASATSGLPLQFSSSDPETVTIDENKLIIKKMGTVAITASQPGDGDYEPAAQVVQTLLITGRFQQINFRDIRGILDQFPFRGGDIVIALQATASSGLPVNFTVSDTTIASISNRFLVIHKPGTFIVTAIQAGNDDYAEASAAQTLTVDKITQTITLAPAEERAYQSEKFTVAASTSSGLPLSLTSSDTTILSIDGTEATMHQLGQVTITAIQEGNDIYLSASVEQVLTIHKSLQTIGFTMANNVTYDPGPFRLVATVSSDLPLEFVSSDPSILKIEGDSATMIRAGQVTITVLQEGNEFYDRAERSQTLTIEKVAQDLSFELVPALSVGSKNIRLLASASSQLPVSFESSNEDVVVMDGDSLVVVGAGTTVITARQEGSDRYLPVEKAHFLTIHMGIQDIDFESIGNHTLSEQTLTLYATSSTGLPVSFSVASSHAKVEGNQLTLLRAGKVVVSATQEGDENYKPWTVSQTFCINPDKPVLEWSAGASTLTSSNSDGNSWYLDEVSLVEGTPIIEVVQSGSYSVRTIVESCISEVSDPFFLLITSNDVNHENQVSVYPTIVDRSIRIVTGGIFSDKLIGLIIYNASGQVVHQSEIENNRDVDIATERFSPGYYRIVLTDHTTRILRGFMVKR